MKKGDNEKIKSGGQKHGEKKGKRENSEIREAGALWKRGKTPKTAKKEIVDIAEEEHCTSLQPPRVSWPGQSRRNIPGPSLQPCPPAGPATQRQDAGRDVHLQDFRGKLARSLLSLCLFVLQLLLDELQEQSDPFLCQGLWSTGIKWFYCQIVGRNQFCTCWNCIVQHSQLW